MKAMLYDSKGSKKGDIELPELFNFTIREDIAAKYFEADKFDNIQPYGSYSEAGKRHSASGTISHRRHEWKGHYGKGISRIPRKSMWRRGTQFYWVGAEVSNTRGGRRAHPPKGLITYRKINKKEVSIALFSAIAATANKQFIIKRYSSLSDINGIPAVLESLPSKTKDLKSLISNIFGDNFNLAFKNKEVRSGKGKLRGRKYKSNAGLLIVKSNKETNNFKGVEVKSVNDLKISDLYPLGRLTVFTQKSLEELKNVA